jgi:hypothetical protein
MLAKWKQFAETEACESERWEGWRRNLLRIFVFLCDLLWLMKLVARLPTPFTLIVISFVWLTSIGGVARGHAASRPNLIVIFSDDQGYHEFGCYGSEIATSVLDRLAQDEMCFTPFYAASSICTPPRYGLLTGRDAHRSADQLTAALVFLSEQDPHESNDLSKQRPEIADRLAGLAEQA